MIFIWKSCCCIFDSIFFYDDSRREVGVVTLGPFIGTHNWSPVRKIVRVPIQAREAILRVGLFGGVGEFSIDDLKIQTNKRWSEQILRSQCSRSIVKMGKMNV